MFATNFRKFTTTTYRQAVKYSEEVKQALAKNTAVVALESTIISHGMPYPENFATAVAVEDVVRSRGATPATVALMDGDLYVGLERDQLQRLAQDGQSATKCSRRDLARVLSKKGLGATTVSGTMIAADLAGVDVFVTGGIGGVHRGVEETMDVSADLSELGRTPVVVICAGVKSILDISRTLEYLETQGVAVMCWKTDLFPAFFTVDSGEAAPMRVESADEVAQWIAANHDLGLRSGAIVAVPNPEPANEKLLNSALKTALDEVRDQRIQGKLATPYLLKRINELTGGDSLRSNIALVKNNARVGADIAVARSGRRHFSSSSRRAAAHGARDGRGGRPIVIGGATVDMTAQCEGDVVLGTSNVGCVHRSYGGVGRNIVECLGRYASKRKEKIDLKQQPLFITVTGDDEVGSGIVEHLQQSTVNVEGIHRVVGARTAMYNAVLDGRGDLIAAVADMDILESEELNLHIHSCAAGAEAEAEAETGAEVEKKQLLSCSSSDLIIVDGNLTETAMLTMISSVPENVPIWYEPTSVVKSNRCLVMLHRIELMSPNWDELISIGNALNVLNVLEEEEVEEEEEEEWSNGMCTVERVTKVSEAVVSAMVAAASSSEASRWLVVTMGKQGVVLCHGVRRVEGGDGEESSKNNSNNGSNNNITLTTTHFKPETVREDMVNCTGAGDCLLATVAAASMRGVDMENAVRIGMSAASLTILDEVAVSPLLTRDWLESELSNVLPASHTGAPLQ